jgi:hypothetical protein
MAKAATLNLLICGAMRSGTTALARCLDEHPEIAFLPGALAADRPDLPAGTGEFPFASPCLALAQAGDDGKVYRRMAARVPRAVRHVGERRAYFMFYPHIPLNLREHLPDARLLFVLRDPVEAAYSAFWHGREFYPQPSFDAYLAEAVQGVREAAHWRKRHRWLERFSAGSTLPLLVERGFYLPQFLRFQRLFAARQMLWLHYDEWARKPEATLRRVLAFLDLPADFCFSRVGEKVNPGPARPPMSAAARAFLRELYAPSSRRLLQIMGWPPGLWQQP